MLNRRELFQLTAALAVTGTLSRATEAAPASSHAFTKPLSPSNAAEAHLLWAKLHGDLSGRTVYYFTQGSVWGFLPQGDDVKLEDFARLIYGYSGVAARKMIKQADGSITMRQKSWAFYRDPISDEITDKIPNPYTGKTDTAAPMLGKASERQLNTTATSVVSPADKAEAKMPYDMRIRRLGSHAWITTSSFARFQTPGISWFKLEGNFEDYACLTADLDNPARTHIPNTVAHNLVAEWQTWTGMHGMPGHILFKGNGAPLSNAEEIPVDSIAAIERFSPGSLAEVMAWDR